MEVRTYNVYPWAELPKEAREKALQRYYDINVDNSHWYENCQIEQIADKRGLKVSFDNLCFDLYQRSLYFTEIEILPKFWDLIKVKRSKVEALEVSYSCSSYYERSLIDTNDDKITEKANEALRRFNRECLEWLQKDYDYLTSEEAIVETFEANEYLFTLEGEID